MLPRRLLTLRAPRPSGQLPIVQQRRTVGTGPKDDGDLGGPGGQESYPESQPIHRRYAAITATSVLAIGGMLTLWSGRGSTHLIATDGAGQAYTNPGRERDSNYRGAKP